MEMRSAEFRRTPIPLHGCLHKPACRFDSYPAPRRIMSSAALVLIIGTITLVLVVPKKEHEDLHLHWSIRWTNAIVVSLAIIALFILSLTEHHR